MLYLMKLYTSKINGFKNAIQKPTTEGYRLKYKFSVDTPDKLNSENENLGGQDVVYPSKVPP